MILREILVIALRGLRAHKMRSGLTMLGLIIGVAAVILLTSFGQGVAGSVNSAIAPVANNITVVPKLSPIPGGPPAEPLTDADERAISKIPEVSEQVPLVTGATTGAAGPQSVAVTASTPTAQFTSASVAGTTANYLSASQKKLAAGTFFNDEQDQSGAKVAVLGPLIDQALYGPDPNAAVGKTVRLNHVLFKVVGVLQSYGSSGDNVIVMPLKAARSGVFGYGYGGDELSSITVKATSTLTVKAAEDQITQVLMADHHITDPRYEDFQVQDLGARLTTFEQLITLITHFVPAIAAVSLLVGGIGVLNIMLVSVTDRTREIGTRKAIGASDSAILGQFIIEAMALAGLGGLIGVVLGVGLILLTKLLIPYLGTTGFLSSFDPVLAASPIAVAFVISLAIGLLAGGYPAWRAAQLNPIEALRYE
ncbi:MAG: putative transport system permease protein [Pseudonocardiales bacterium]|jgi:putative ABC transport system permease protein|nr:putative transport system permease protein [Pseudonocardiales bacterium]MDT7607631.1 putative transport system permease protein [Pseudonocardiales bacterium]MDT7641077.1 putative transport system permease protein [Pseudonocardiales bacterium]MDT7659359.1 putative transport system permease protein [Pseudonocardiales bacterium]